MELPLEKQLETSKGEVAGPGEKGFGRGENSVVEPSKGSPQASTRMGQGGRNDSADRGNRECKGPGPVDSRRIWQAVAGRAVWLKLEWECGRRWGRRKPQSQSLSQARELRLGCRQRTKHSSICALTWDSWSTYKGGSSRDHTVKTPALSNAIFHRRGQGGV